MRRHAGIWLAICRPRERDLQGTVPSFGVLETAPTDGADGMAKSYLDQRSISSVNGPTCQETPDEHGSTLQGQ